MSQSPVNLNWWDKATCFGLASKDGNYNRFFPDPNAIDYNKRVEIAKSICSNCPVSGKCLQYAIDLDIPEGIFGGMTYNERRKLVKKTMRADSAIAELRAMAKQIGADPSELTPEDLLNDVW
jgi:WhiB family transcriptional regulator, redox-sensing transcriptional regulator